MSAPLGNRNAAKAKEWTDALKWQLENYETSSVKRGMALREIAKTVVMKAIEGEKDAWQEIGNRLDGKPVQAIEGTGDNGEITVKFTSADKGVL